MTTEKEPSVPTFSPNRIKVGDKLIREHDHLSRFDDTITVTGKFCHGVTQYRLANYWRETETAKSLAAQGYRIVERGGKRIARFFTVYW